MTDKQITIDYENLCANYSKEVGCYNTFDGSCIKEQCFTYRLLQLLKAKEQECERLKWYLKEIRYDELKTLDIELDEYETHCIDTEYTNIINLVEEALEERSPEDCRYKKDK